MNPLGVAQSEVMRELLMDYVVERIALPEDFLDRTAIFRNEHPMETNIMGSVAASVAAGTRRYPSCFWWIVTQGDVIVGIAMRTVPYRLVVSPMPAGAAGQLAHAVFENDPECWGVNGPQAIATEFIKCWCLESGRPASDFPIHLRETIYVLGRHTPRAGVPGTSRRANDNDVPLLLSWLAAFVSEVGLSNSEVPDETVLLSRLRTTPILLWENEGRPVAMAGHAAIVDDAQGHTGRIGPVFTEPSERGNGYGAAVTSSMIEHLLSIDCTTIMLYTDSDYAKSNRVYQQLGFVPKGSILELGRSQ